MPTTELNEPQTYTRQFSRGIDDSRRVMIPKEWRREDQSITFAILPWPIGEEAYLLALPPARWKELLERLNAMSLSNDQAAVVERVIGGTCAHLSPDKTGRICLPQELTQAVGISREALFVGRLQKFEIWDPQRFEAVNQSNKQMAAAAIKNLIL